MPKLTHWITQFLIAASAMFALLLVIDLLMRDETMGRAWPSALLWSVLASALFVGTRYRNIKHGIDCIVCTKLDKQ